MEERDIKAFTMRIDAKLLDRVDRIARRYERYVAAGHPGHILSRAQVMRVALQMGLDAIETIMKKGGSK
jgi:predicted transcriptional regulator